MSLYQDSVKNCCMTHGEYNYHNILMVQGSYNYKKEPYRIATTSFEKFKRDVQVEGSVLFPAQGHGKHGWKETAWGQYDQCIFRDQADYGCGAGIS